MVVGRDLEQKAYGAIGNRRLHGPAEQHPGHSSAAMVGMDADPVQVGHVADDPDDDVPMHRLPRDPRPTPPNKQRVADLVGAPGIGAEELTFQAGHQLDVVRRGSPQGHETRLGRLGMAVSGRRR